MKILVFLIFIFSSFNLTAQRLYLQMQPGECVSCITSIELLGKYEPIRGKRTAVFPEGLKADSSALYRKYGASLHPYQIIWSDSLFDKLGTENAISKIVIVDGDGAIISRQYLKEMSAIPSNYSEIFDTSVKVQEHESVRSFSLSYKTSGKKLSFERENRFGLGVANQNWCDLPIPGRAKVSVWNDKAIIHNQLDNKIFVANPTIPNIDTIGLESGDMLFYFEALYPDRQPQDLFRKYQQEVASSPASRPNVLSYYVDSARLYFHISFYYNVDTNYLPGSIFGFYESGKSYYYPVKTEEFFMNQNVIGIPIYAVNIDTIIVNSFRLDSAIAEMRPKDNTSMLGQFVKNKNGIYEFDRALPYFYEGVYKKIGNNLLSLVGEAPFITYLITDKIYSINNHEKVLKMPISNFDFSSINSLGELVNGVIPYRNIELVTSPKDRNKAYLLYSVSKSDSDRKVYLLHFSVKDGHVIYEKEISGLPPLSKLMSFGMDINNERLFFVETYGKCIEFLDFPEE